MDALWINGIATDIGAPCIQANDRGLSYGDGLFATMRVSYGKILFLGSHLSRLQQSAHRLGFGWQISQQSQSAMLEAAQQYPNSCLKLMVSRGAGGRGYTPPEQPDLNEIISVQSIPTHYRNWQRSGIALATSSIQLGQQPRLAGIKHLNRLEQVLIKRRPLPQWADDSLALDAKGDVIETSMANIFFIDGQSVITPVLSHSGVSGVMRQQIIEALIELGFDIKMTRIDYLGDRENDTESVGLPQFQHAFITNSLLGCVDVTRIDAQYFQAHPVTEILRRKLNIQL
ncbi:aminodeoxychorismate lyase [Shewanella gelidii]|uniref:Aminodeoxychorismate lyase n=1 Tax=Shewanella gelidii TaxID=1642821 RepID=A0A917ND59_9GAMM|nr:aminodeoxychorismate lyase [Shewanella gelidii]MCL1099020.1 aminodeoxychorismate lyase [Shewanella gelidii]GGI88794.1 4-amino-4-deoxychorismate lyase [Shewanella gelidii]